MRKPFNIAIDKSPLEILQDCGGYYECPKDASGNRLGPLVGYAGTYGDGKHYVGDVYANFAKAEEYPFVLESFGVRLKNLLPKEVLEEARVFCGAPLGGMAFAYQLALLTQCRYVFAEKKVTKAATGSEREESKLVWGRHEITIGDDVVIVEDVNNNFSTTEDLIALIKKAGGRVLAIASLLNRSLTVDDVYQSPSGGSIPVLSLVRKPIDQYVQDSPAVQADIQAGNVVWKPKADWERLTAAMASTHQ